MPVLKNARHERFAQEVAKGKSATEAYKAAGYDGDRTAASRLSTKGNVQSRITELKEKAAEKAGVSIESLTVELEEARQLALADPKGGAAAVSATMGKAKLHGLLVEKAEVTGKDGGAIQTEDVGGYDLARRIALALSGSK